MSAEDDRLHLGYAGSTYEGTETFVFTEDVPTFL